MEKKAKKLERRRVVVCFVLNRGKMLLLKRSGRVGSYRGKWHGVAGHIEKNETPEQTAWKELREEIRIPRRCLKLICAGRPHEHKEKSIGIAWLVHPFLFKSSTRRVKMDWEHTEYRWITPEEIKKFDIVPSADKSLERVLKPDKSPPSR